MRVSCSALWLWCQQLQSIDNMINNYRSRSFSFRSFKRSHNSSALPNSAIFTPARKKSLSSSADASYLAISYASPQQYYTNHHKNNAITRLECHLPLNDSASIRPRRFPSSVFQRGKEATAQTDQSHFLKQQRQRCLYNYFASLAHKGQQEGEVAREERGKAKSILLIRKINKKKEEMVERVKQKMEQQFRNRKQVPIHHTQFHFHNKNKKKTEPSPHSPHHTQQAEFSKKIHRAVEEILKLRATSNSPQQSPQKCTVSQEEFRGIIIEGGNFSPFQQKPSLSLSKSTKVAMKKKARTACAAEGEEIGPWVRSSNDFQFLF